MKSALKNSRVVAGALVVFVLMIVSYNVQPVDWQASSTSAKLIKERAEIIKQNTEIIKSLGGCAETNSAVTDLLLRVSHYTENHKRGDEHFFCPECVEGKTSIAEKYFVEQDEFPTEEVPTTHKQVLRDLRGIETSIDSITFGHLSQMKTLENKLLKHRNQEKLLLRIDANDFFGGLGE
jgi:hypothetical protein